MMRYSSSMQEYGTIILVIVEAANTLKHKCEVQPERLVMVLICGMQQPGFVRTGCKPLPGDSNAIPFGGCYEFRLWDYSILLNKEPHWSLQVDASSVFLLQSLTQETGEALKHAPSGPTNDQWLADKWLALKIQRELASGLRVSGYCI